MEGEKFLCPNCGMPVEASAMNFKTRRAHCDFCGKEIIFPKRSSTASPNAVHALEEATRFFMEKNYASAKTCAETVVSMVPGNAPALYIIAYYNAFVAPVKNRSSLDRLFKETLPDVEFEIEEEEAFKSLLIKTILYASIYEEEIICKFVEFDDASEAAEFIENFCPFTIAKRTTYTWLTPELVDAFKAISKKAAIPKTWYALLVSVSKNPESPLATGQFYLRTKSANFYNNYLLPVGEILSCISDQTMKTKFVTVFNKLKADFEAKLNG